MVNGWSLWFQKWHLNTDLYYMNWKEYFNVSEIIGYFFRKKDPNASSYMKMMYWANRIAITMFLVCLIVIIYRLFIR